MTEENSNLTILKTLFQHRFKILIITMIFSLAAVALSFIVTKKYTSFGIVYPTASNSINNELDNPDFGYEMHSSRLIQLFESKLMQDMVINKFDLINYYKLDTSKSGWVHSLQKKYTTDISFSKTKHKSVLITAQMTNPQLSADIVNSMIFYVDTIRRNLFLNNAQKVAHYLGEKVTFQKTKTDSLLLLITTINTNSPNRISEEKLAIINERAKKGTQFKGDIIINKKLIDGFSIESENIINSYYHELGLLNKFKNELTEVETTLTAPFPEVYKVSLASVDDKNNSNSLFKNILFGAFFGFVIGVLFFIGSARLTDLKKQLK